MIAFCEDILPFTLWAKTAFDIKKINKMQHRQIYKVFISSILVLSIKNFEHYRHSMQQGFQ